MRRFTVVVTAVAAVTCFLSCVVLLLAAPHLPDNVVTNNSTRPACSSPLTLSPTPSTHRSPQSPPLKPPPPPRQSTQSAPSNPPQSLSPPPRHRAAVHRNECPALYATEDSVAGIANTGRRALVVFTVTHRKDLFERQIEIDNYAFFRRHAMFPPAVRTALFSGVDYAIMRVDVSRSSGGVRECTRGAPNVRVFEAPSGPCDLCAVSRLFTVLGLDALAQRYEFISVMNSGVRGPFFTESKLRVGAGSSASPVTWIDHLALGGEKVYTGRVISSTSIAKLHRPHMQSFTLHFPAAALPAVHPVLGRGCDLAPVSGEWESYASTFEIDINAATDRTAAQKSLADGTQNQAARDAVWRRYAAATKLTEADAALQQQLDAGNRHRQRGMPYLRLKPQITDPKLGCIARAEIQLTHSLLNAKAAIGTSRTPWDAAPAHLDDFAELPLLKVQPPAGSASQPAAPHTMAGNKSRSGDGAPPYTAVLPLFSPAEYPLLSAVVRRAVVEGPHFVARSMMNGVTVLSLPHAEAVVPGRPPRAGVDTTSWPFDICAAVFPKIGGTAWQARWVHPDVLADVQALGVSQPQPTGVSKDLDGGHMSEVDRCPGTP